MIFNMNNAGMTSNVIYNQTKIVLSQSMNNSNPSKKENVFKIVTSPSFSLSSSNKNINYNRTKQTKNG